MYPSIIVVGEVTLLDIIDLSAYQTGMRCLIDKLLGFAQSLCCPFKYLGAGCSKRTHWRARWVILLKGKGRGEIGNAYGVLLCR